MGMLPLLGIMLANSARANVTQSTLVSNSGRCTVNTPNKIGEKYRESITRHAIREAKPGIFGWFSICPVNNAALALGLSGRNDAYNLLTAYHCVNRRHIPKEIRKRIPELIREALSEEA
jgi:hypothetical protein